VKKNNIKKVVAACAFLLVTCSTWAMKNVEAKETSSNEKGLVTLPKASVLKDRLLEGGFDHFLEKTKLDEKLSGKKLHPLGVSLSVELALYDYAQDLNNPMMAMLMQKRKPQLFEIILKDFPKTLEKLKKATEPKEDKDSDCLIQ